VIASIPETIPRAALITGGETELGLGLAHALANAGFAIALQCHAPLSDDPPEGTEVLRADLSVETRAAALVARATARLGPVGVLIHAAGTAALDTWEETTRSVWDAHFETKVRAPFVLIQQFAHALPEDREGVAIALVDQRVTSDALSWTLANAALWTLTQSMALTLAPRIRVNAIAAAPVMVGLSQPGMAGRGAGGLSRHGAGRDGRVRPGHGDEAIANAAIAILALPSMTGQIMVPGGVTVRAARQGTSIGA
jgi:NAD(P)-dependent dehydrogenase (short-subunit alcohol dehydrogenase family)